MNPAGSCARKQYAFLREKNAFFLEKKHLKLESSKKYGVLDFHCTFVFTKFGILMTLIEPSGVVYKKKQHAFLREKNTFFWKKLHSRILPSVCFSKFGILTTCFEPSVVVDKKTVCLPERKKTRFFAKKTPLKLEFQ